MALCTFRSLCLRVDALGACDPNRASVYRRDCLGWLYVAGGQRCLHSILTQWYARTGVNAGETRFLLGTGVTRRSVCQPKCAVDWSNSKRDGQDILALWR